MSITFKIDPESTSVAKPIQAAVKAKEEADRAEQLVNAAVSDINSARDTALSQISTAETNAVQEVNDARDAGVIAVQDARDQGIGAIETARDTALNQISQLVTQAQGFRDESEAFKNDAQKQAQSTEPFVDSEGNEYANGSKGYWELTEEATNNAINTFSGVLSVTQVNQDEGWIGFIAIDPATVTKTNEVLTGATGESLTVEILNIENLRNVIL